MENTIKKSWRDVTINEYFDLKETLEETTDINEQIIIKIAFANNMTEDEVWGATINDFQKLQKESEWMEKFEISQKLKFKTIEIDGEKYVVDTNLQNFSIAQYIDFQTFYPQRKINERILGNILACLIIPKGKKYGEGYDIQELVKKINSNLDILTANELMFFFLKQYLISTWALVNYFNWQMKKLKRKNKKSENMMKAEMEWEQTKKNILDGFRSLIA